MQATDEGEGVEGEEGGHLGDPDAYPYEDEFGEDYQDLAGGEWSQS